MSLSRVKHLVSTDLASRSVMVLGFAFIAACDGFFPDVGAPLVDRCTGDDSDPAAEISFSADIQKGIIGADQTCLPCHDPRSDLSFGFELSGLDLTSYSGLMAGGVNSGVDIVLPGDPCNSTLVKKLLLGPPFGSRMPFQATRYLSDAQVQTVMDWIAEGAEDN